MKACSIHKYKINVLIHEKQFHLHDLKKDVYMQGIEHQL
jgi:hypothetical protein